MVAGSVSPVLFLGASRSMSQLGTEGHKLSVKAKQFSDESAQLALLHFPRLEPATELLQSPGQCHANGDTYCTN